MRNKYNTERIKLQSDLDAQREKYNESESEKKSTIFKLQMELTLATDKINHA